MDQCKVEHRPETLVDELVQQLERDGLALVRVSAWLPTQPPDPMRSLVCALACGCGRIAFDPLADTRSQDAPMLATACPSDSRLLACFAFDGDLVDGSPATNDAAGMGITFVPGIEGQALQQTTGSYVELLVGVDLSTTRLTVDVWLRLDNVDQVGIAIDHDSHWALKIDVGGFVACNNVLSTAPVLLATWTHVACTYDGTTMTAHVGGVAAGSAALSGWATGTGTVALGSNGPITDTPRYELRGAIDRLRIWNDLLSPDELCSAAGGCARAPVAAWSRRDRR